MSRTIESRSRDRVLDSAAEVFLRKEVDTVTVDDLLVAASVSRESFSRHFTGVESVLRQIVEDWLSRCQLLFAFPAEYADGLPWRGDSTDAPDALLDFCIERDLQLYEFLWRTRHTIMLLRARRLYDPLVHAFKAEMQQRNRAWLEHVRREGWVRGNVDLEIAAVLISGAYEELSLRMLRSSVHPPLEDWLETAQETFVRAFGTAELISALERRSRRTTSGVRGLLHDVPNGGDLATGRSRTT